MDVTIKKLADTATSYVLDGKAASWGNHPISLIANNQEAILNDVNLALNWLIEDNEALSKNFAVRSITERCMLDAFSAAVYDIVLDDCNDLGTFLTLLRHYISAYVTKIVDSINLPKEVLPPGGYQKGLLKELGNRLLYANEFFNYMADKGKGAAVERYNKYRRDVSKQAVLDMIQDNTILGGGVFGEDYNVGNDGDVDVSEVYADSLGETSFDTGIGSRVGDDELTNQAMDLQTIGSRDEHVAKVVSEEEKELATYLEKKAKSQRTKQRLNRAAATADDDFDQFLI